MHNDIGLPFFSCFQVNASLDWQMSRAEKYCMIDLLQTLKPEVSLEIGTYKGGSLQVLSHFSQNVISLDISTEPKRLLEDKFSNVQFVIGDSSSTVSSVLTEQKKSGKKVEFILIDGDHSRIGVYRDLKAVLDMDWQHPVTIVLHDSFNPECRRGMLDTHPENYLNVHYFELDYVTGSFSHNDVPREMWGGLGLIKILPQERKEPLFINKSQQKLFEATYLHSKHVVKDKLLFLKPLKKYLRK